MAFYKQDIVDVNLETGVIHRSFLNHTIGHKDDDADRFGIRAFRNGEPVDLSGAQCQAVFMAPDGTNIALTSYGTVSGNEAYVTLPQACYNVEGQFCLAIKLVGGGVTATVRIIDGVVDRTGATGAVAPTEAVPTYQEILAVYAEMQEDVADYESVVATQNGKIDDLKSALTITEDAVFTKGSAITVYRTAAGYRYDSIGQASATRDDDYHVQFFAVTDDEYYINTAADSFCAFSTNDSTGNTFGQAYVGYSGLVKKPSTANYFVVSKKKTDSTTCIKPIVLNIDSLESEIEQLGTAIDDAKDEIADTYKKVYAVKTDNIEVGWINTSGAEKETGNYHRTDYIPIKNGESLKYKLSHGTTQPIIAYYNTSKVYDNSKSVIGENGYSEGTYTATADGFLRFVYLDARDDVYVKFTDVIPDNVRLLIKSASLGEINILLMGDSIFGNDGEIAGFLSEKYTSCVNGAFGGTRVTDRGGSDNFQYFDGVNIIHALCTQTWTDQDAAATALSGSYPWITGRLARLKAVDMSKVDVLIMDWGTNDYTASATIEQINTAYESVIDMLQTAYPSLHILITTPIWRYFSSSENGDNKVFNVSTLKEIALAIEQMAKNKRITVFNAYQNIPLSYATASTYFDSGDSTHLNTAGNEVYAGYLSGMIKLILG